MHVGQFKLRTLFQAILASEGSDRDCHDAILAPWLRENVGERELGELMFSRAGVVVRAGRDHIDPESAVSSTLYWA